MSRIIYKRKVLNLEDKVAVIKAMDSGKKNVTVSREFGLSKSTVYSILQSKEKILKMYNKGNTHVKKIRFCAKPNIDVALYKWYIHRRNANLPISGSILKDKAEEFGHLLGHSGFVCSNSWIDRFKVRHKISLGKSRGKSKSINIPIEIVKCEVETQKEEEFVKDVKMEVEDTSDTERELVTGNEVFSAIDVIETFLSQNETTMQVIDKFNFLKYEIKRMVTDKFLEN